MLFRSRDAPFNSDERWYLFAVAAMVSQVLERLGALDRERDARFEVEDEKQFPGFNPAYLFRDGLAVITPLLWLLFALNLMGYFFLASWTPTLLAAAKLPLTLAAVLSPLTFIVLNARRAGQMDYDLAAARAQDRKTALAYFERLRDLIPEDSDAYRIVSDAIERLTVANSAE